MTLVIRKNLQVEYEYFLLQINKTSNITLVIFWCNFIASITYLYLTLTLFPVMELMCQIGTLSFAWKKLEHHRAIKKVLPEQNLQN